MKRLEDPRGPIDAAAGEVLAIVLPANPTTGYSWQVEADDAYLALLSQEFEPAGPAVGAGGREVFQFRALRPGSTDLRFQYRRPWEGQAIETRQYQVTIRP
ncbi:MAG TPA: protease inhibitor I42 family protein [Anaerolineae bacterium]|nr:protease inhibitor I42 family protein [Anaerolineae bacterium]